MHGRLNQLLQRVLFHVVKRGKEHPGRRQHRDGEGEHDDGEPDAEPELGAHRQPSHEHVSGALPLAAQQPENQGDEHGRVEEQKRRDVAERELAVGERRESREREHVRDRELRRNAGAQGNLEERRRTSRGGRVRCRLGQGLVRGSVQAFDFTGNLKKTS